ncbi:hypothetical protein RUND412_000424 [Rhizina undulata]
MSALATIENPLRPNEILEFYLTNTNNLGLKQVNENDPNGEKPKEGLGNIKNPSSFATIIYKNLISVYGINTDNRVALLSPVYRPVVPAATATFGSLAATTDGNKAGWLYYLSGSDATEIHEFSLQFNSAAGIQSAPLNGSYLGAFYEPQNGQRYVVYQGKNLELRVLNILSVDDHILQQTAGAKSKTPLGVSVVERPDGFQVYIYYADLQNVLQRVVRGTNGVWGPVTPLLQAPRLADWSQLSITPSKGEEANYVFYAGSEGAGEILTYVDSFIKA